MASRASSAKRKRKAANTKAQQPKALKKTPKPKSKSKPRSKNQLSFHQRLDRLTVRQACNLLGDDGPKLMQQGRMELTVDFNNV